MRKLLAQKKGTKAKRSCSVLHNLAAELHRCSRINIIVTIEFGIRKLLFIFICYLVDMYSTHIHTCGRRTHSQTMIPITNDFKLETMAFQNCFNKSLFDFSLKSHFNNNAMDSKIKLCLA